MVWGKKTKNDPTTKIIIIIIIIIYFARKKQTKSIYIYIKPKHLKLLQFFTLAQYLNKIIILFK